jgi:undecaprenyl diphosphate synthase
MKLKELKKQLDPSKIPKHVAFILDGNRRWCKKKKVSKFGRGHVKGAKVLENITDFCEKLGVKYLSAYVFSIENFKRTKEEKEFFFKVLVDTINKNIDKFDRDNVKLNAFGRLYMFPKDVQEVVRKAVEKTNNNNKYFVNLCFGYDGQCEIVDAAKEICEKVEKGKMRIDDINRLTFKQHLYTKDIPAPELIVRTGMGKEKRLSGFLLWDSSYSEFYFTKTLWPDFTKEELVKAMIDFQKRDRRFGA